MRSTPVGGCGRRERKTELLLFVTFAVLNGEGVRREEFDPSADARVVFAYVGDVLEHLVAPIRCRFCWTRG